jgi:hypothetical protein
MFSSATLCSFNTATALITVFPVPEDETMKYIYSFVLYNIGESGDHGDANNRWDLINKAVSHKLQFSICVKFCQPRYFFFYFVGWDLTPIRSLCRSPRFV